MVDGIHKTGLKAYLPKTMFGRALLILIIPVFLLQLFTAYMFFDRHWSKMTQRAAASVAGEVALVSRALSQGADPDVSRRILDYVRRDLALEVGVVRPAELSHDVPRVQADGVWSHVVGEILYYQLSRKLRQPFRVESYFNTKRVHVFVQLDDGVLHISLHQNKLFSSSAYIFLLWTIGSSMVLMFVAVVFMRNQIRPIRRLAVAAERFGRGLELLGFRPQGALEVRQAGEAFLIMSQRIKRQISQRTEMLAGVSHDLRTPLTRMKLQLAMMEESEDVAALRGDIDEMEKMLGGYLDFVRGEGTEEPSMVSLELLLDKVVSNATRHGGSVEVCGDVQVSLRLREMAFERCLTNVVGNALAYAEHVWIGVDADRSQELLTLRVEDDGPGLAEDQFEEVFKPFYRVDASRSSETGGVGLGLPIAMDIVHAHGGKIWLEKSEHGGLAVFIRLPM